MLVKKVCLIGDFAVGKTSLTARFVHSTFSNKYLTTVGVKVDSKEVTLLDGRVIKLMIWDIAGTSALRTVEERYLRGAAAYILVADGTRKETLESALRLDQMVQKTLGQVPRILILNKQDLEKEWEIEDCDITPLLSPDRPIYRCSALKGTAVNDAFLELVTRIDRGY